MPLTRPTTLGNRPDHLHIGRVDLEVARNTDGPGKFANREPVAERRAQPIPGIRQDAAKTHTGRGCPTLPKPMTSAAKAAGRFGKQDFVYVAADDVYRCPAGEALKYYY